MHQNCAKLSCKRAKRRTVSVIATAKADQSLEVGYAFSPYGQTQKVGVEDQIAGSENSSQYTGRENDNNGLYFYRARYYDPILKRFISEDPIGLDGGWNMYSYVNGAPTMFTDPDGLRLRLQLPPGTNVTIPPIGYVPRPGPQPVPVNQRPPSTPNNNEGNNLADNIGAITGGGKAGKHPSVPGIWEDTLNPLRPRTDPMYPSYIPTGCYSMPVSQGMCPAKPAIYCGSIAR
jgi:RHS repeat-associated protein